METSIEKPETESVDYGPLEQSLGFLLRLAQIRVFSRFHVTMAESSPSPGAFSVLLVIGCNAGIRQGVLARALAIKPANIVKLLKQFEDDGLIVRTAPLEDKRAFELSLTRKGEALLRDHSAAFARHEANAHAPLTAREKDQLVSLLARFVGISGEG